MNNVSPLLPKLVVNGQFMRDFMTAATPCCALSVIEDRKQQSGLLALRLDDVIPREVADWGFRFGHSLLGTARFEVVHFAFEFYGFKTYNVLLNPNNPLVQAVLSMMLSSGGYFFFVLNSDTSVTAFREAFAEDMLGSLMMNLPRIQHSQTTDAEYRQAVAHFSQHPYPQGQMLDWVCCDDAGYLDLSRDRLELNPDRS